MSVLVTNTGSFTGVHQVSLKMDDVVVETSEVTLDGGDSETLSFSMTPDTVGEHTVNVSDLLETFEVKALEAPSAPIVGHFQITDLSVTPSEVNLNEQVNISAVVTNTGGSEGSYTVVLKINSVEETRKEVTLGAGKTEAVTLTIAKDVEGSYTVDIDGRLGQFTVIVPTPATPTEAPLVEIPTNRWLLRGILSSIILISIVSMIMILLRRKTDGKQHPKS